MFIEVGMCMYRLFILTSRVTRAARTCSALETNFINNQFYFLAKVYLDYILIEK